jgi:ABC-type Zn uptake system ZnuABC Zn-binding protein ZnuA
VLKEVPSRGGLTRALGDIHVFGNTHYLLDPLNGLIIGRTVRDALKQAAPDHAGDFERRYEEFAGRVRAVTETLVEKMKPFEGAKVITFHRSWPYFLDRFGLVSIGEVEPKPGITPGPQHLQACVDRMRAENAKLVIVETFSSKKQADFVADKVGGMSVVLPLEVSAVPECDDYFKLFEYNVDTLIEAFHQLGVAPR